MIGPHACPTIMGKTSRAANDLPSTLGSCGNLRYLCPACVEAKAQQLAVPRTTFNRPAAAKLDDTPREPATRIHFDVLEISRHIVSWQGNRYATLFIDRDTEMEFIFFHPDKASWLEKALDPMLRELVTSDKTLQAFMSDAEHL